ncbi:MAG: LuxR family transcriptional regulator [Treponema sp.]|nr:LuxR family transcriptional regulator [Treponema sp.]
MDKNSINKERVVSLVGFIFLVVAAITGFLWNGDHNSILHRFIDTAVLIPWTHVICAAFAFILIFKPNDKVFIIVVNVESFLLLLTDYCQLGIFFFWASIILIFVKDIFKSHNKYVLTTLGLLHCVALLGSYTHGWKSTFIAIGNSAFCFVFYMWIYSILKAKLSCFLPSNVSNNQTISNKKPGESIKLSDYELTERQSTFVLENLHNNLSYKEISDKYFVSISTVKKTFAEVYKIFNVTKLEELRILLLQYQVQA